MLPYPIPPLQQPRFRAILLCTTPQRTSAFTTDFPTASYLAGEDQLRMTFSGIMASHVPPTSPLPSLLSLPGTPLTATEGRSECGSPSPPSHLPGTVANLVLSSPPPSPTRLDPEFDLAPSPHRSSRYLAPRKPAHTSPIKAQPTRSLTPKSKLPIPKSGYLLHQVNAKEVTSDLALIDRLTLASELDRRAAQSKDYALMSAEHKALWRQAQTPAIRRELVERRRQNAEADAAYKLELEMKRELGERARQSAAYQHSNAEWKAKWRAYMRHKIMEEWEAAKTPNAVAHAAIETTPKAAANPRKRRMPGLQMEETQLVFPVEETLRRQKLCERFQAQNRRYIAKLDDVRQAKDVAWKPFYADGQAYDYWQPYVFQMEVPQVNVPNGDEGRGGSHHSPVSSPATSSGTLPPPGFATTPSPGASSSSSASPTTPSFSPVWGSSPLPLSAERGTFDPGDVLPGPAGKEQPVLLSISQSSALKHAAAAAEQETTPTRAPQGPFNNLAILIQAAAEIEAAMNEVEPIPVPNLESAEPSLDAATALPVDSDGDIVMGASELPMAQPLEG